MTALVTREMYRVTGCIDFIELKYKLLLLDQVFGEITINSYLLNDLRFPKEKCNATK